MDEYSPDTVSPQLADAARRARRRVRWLEWAVLAAILLGLTALLGLHRGLERIDLALTDQLARFGSRSVSPDIVIVAIDDKSLAEIGRWPWRRAFHAALLEKLTDAAPRAVGLDLILTEDDTTDAIDDPLLARAMARNGRVVLPLMLQDRYGTGRLTEAAPVQTLGERAAALGHIHLEIDSDGIVRSAFLKEGNGNMSWEHLGVAVLRTGGFQLPDPLPGLRRSDADGLASAAPATRQAPAGPGTGVEAGSRSNGLWQRDHWMQIPFAGAPGRIERVSFVDVIKDRVPADKLRGKYVLVGATAAGMGDAYPTPRSGKSELMPGVEIAANVMNTLLLGKRLERATPWQDAAFNMLPVALALLAVVLMPPTISLIACAALIAATLLTTWLAAYAGGIQFMPVAGLLGCLLVYPLWIWRRLRAAVGYLLEEFQRMETRRALPTMRPAGRSGDVLDRHIFALRDASEQLRNLHRFVSETLNSLPDATLISDASGEVLMSNQAAQRYFGRQGMERVQGRNLAELLVDVHRAGSRHPVFSQGQLQQQTVPWGGEAHDAQGRDLLVRFVPCFNTDGLTTSWIASLVDITPVREAERQRDLALRFISHDMRSPQTSILSLLEVHKLRPGSPMPEDALDRIERHARKTLELAEEFVQLARAESSAYRLEAVELTDLMDDAVDEVWAQAQARQIRFQLERPAHAALVEADRSLLTRAIANLLGNAVKYSHEGAGVQCGVRLVRDGWRFFVTNTGPVMTAAQQSSLFQPFTRLEGGSAGPAGIGLGLVFTRTVIERHDGHIRVSSSEASGTTFEFVLPRLSP